MNKHTDIHRYQYYIHNLRYLKFVNIYNRLIALEAESGILLDYGFAWIAFDSTIEGKLFSYQLP